MILAVTKLFLFGAPRLDRGGEITEMDTRKGLALLAYLALNKGGHSRDSLTVLFYPENDQTSGRAALRRTLSSLRKALGGIGLDAEREQISLDLSIFWVDVIDFRTRIAETQTHGHPAAQTCHKCSQPLEEAVKLYREGFMAGFGLRDSPQFDDWQYFQAEELRQAFAGALQRLARLQAAGADFEAAIARTRQWLSLDQLQEAAHRDLMMYYAWSGQRSAALRQYRECVRILEQELSVPPLDETTNLYQAILENHLPPPPEAEKPLAEIPPDKMPSSPPETRYSSAYPLVGRENERGLLDKAYKKTRGFMFILEGEAGIGKTRLAEEFLNEIQRSGAATADGRCYEGESGLAYTPFLDVLNSVLAKPGSVEKLRRLPAAVIAPAAQLVPSVASLAPELQTELSAGSPGTRLRFFEALRTLLSGLLDGEPQGVVFLDDLHWADADSLDLLAYLTHRLDNLFYLCAWRGDLVPPDHRLRQLYSQAARNGKAGFLALPRLGQAAVSQLVALALDPITSTGGIANQLYSETEGNPFFIVEYLNAMRSAETNGNGEEWAMPTGVREVLRSRLAKVGELGMQLLSAGSVIGHSFDFHLLKEASGRSELETISGCEMLLQHGLIVEHAAPHFSSEIHRLDQPTTDLEYNFTHDKLRALVYDQTSLARRRLLHQRAAEVYAGRARTLDQNNALAAYHYRLAGQPRMAAEFFRKAGEHARQNYANRDAAGYFQSALACGHPEPSGIHEAIGDLEALVGNYNAALAAYETAAALSSPANLPWIESKIGRVHDWRGEWELAECHYEAAAAEIGEEGDPGKAAGLFADWSRAAYRRGELERGQTLAQHALELSKRGDDLLAQAQALDILGLVARARKDYPLAGEYLHASLEVAERLGDASARAAAMNNLGRLNAEMGNLSEALSYTESALQVCIHLGDRHHAAALHNNLADLYHASGQRERAMEQLKKAVVIFAEIGGQTAEPLPEIWKLTEW
jgi:predicted ATPase/DNA-binding SARP family transcriptional activator